MLAGKFDKANRRFLRNLLAGMAGLLAAGMLVLVTLWMQDYSTATFLMISLFIFPVPVACGLAVGLVSPRRAVVWAPLWAATFTFLLFTLLPGGIHNARLALSAWRLVSMAGGTLLAALAGFVGQYASTRNFAGRAIVVFLMMCCGMGLAEYGLVAYRTRVFERDVAPLAIADLDRDYIGLPKDMSWTCARHPREGCYALRSILDGRDISVLVSTDGPRILGVNYERKGGDARIREVRSAREYLRDFGVRDALLSSLSRQKAGSRGWCASLRGTRLTLSRDGSVRMQDFSRYAR